MPHTADNPEPNSTLPHPELNPLVNPVLGAHMGRWAEVYFTSPPEKREEAVLDLLRELEGVAPPKDELSAASMPAHRSEPQPEEARPRHAVEVNDKPQARVSEEQSIADNASQSIPCRSCGRNNPAQHKFCGMCGADIHQSRSLDSPIVDPEEEEVNGWRIEEIPADTGASPTFVGFSPADRNPFGLNWGTDEGPKLLPYSEPVPYRYRIYVGAALAILVSALLYMAWRGTKAGFGSSHSLPPAAPMASPETGAPAQTNLAPKSDTPDAAKTARHEASAAAAPAPTGSPSGSGANKTDSKTNSTPKAPPPSTLAQLTPSARGNGSEELTVAETYLSGTQGKAQDSAEAAKWLWRSVAKQNPSAALMLSDLYLRGSGVSKNCDQARLLLDAAARKGVAGAAQRLRNLPAFGCQ